MGPMARSITARDQPIERAMSQPRQTYTVDVRATYGRRTGDVSSVEIGSNDIYSTCVREITM